MIQVPNKCQARLRFLYNLEKQLLKAVLKKIQALDLVIILRQ